MIANHQVTRWYRPPELILLQGQYTAAVDVRLVFLFSCALMLCPPLPIDHYPCWLFTCLQVWSFGCIFGELVKTLNTAQHPGPLFPGHDGYTSLLMVVLDRYDVVIIMLEIRLSSSVSYVIISML